MAALLTDAVVGGTDTVALTTATQVLISGSFAGAACRIELDADSLNPGIVGEYRQDTQLDINAKTGTTLTATIIQMPNSPSGAASIDVSVI